ncbi:MAG: rhodanese-like domain-containing protein [Ginsengibacter sp.]
MKTLLVTYTFIAAILCISFNTNAQTNKNWSDNQLLEPSELAGIISAKKELPLIISIGPGAYIQNSVSIGMVDNAEGIEKLKKELADHPANTKVVIYCGCCPFEHCPNVRPAIETLKEMNFTNYQLLNLSHNIKIDWIDKGYPVTTL